MVGDNTIDKSPLLPDRMQQEDFFVCDIFDAAPKGDMASMEHPIFSISTKPDRRIRRYENGRNFVEVTPSVKGLATVHDRDVLIYCISQCVAALNAEQEISRVLRFKAYDLLTATNRGKDGRGYEQLKAALERLSGTRIQTNVMTGGREELDDFGLIDRFKIVRETRDGRMQEVEVHLSDWVFNAIRHREVLTLHRDYFRLRKPLERRIYDIARKHCGTKTEWRISLSKLQTKCGSASTTKEFRRLVATIADQDERHSHIPDYAVRLVEDMVIFTNRGSMVSTQTIEASPGPVIHLRPDTYLEARKAAPGWDVYVLEQDWRDWMTEAPRNPDAAFIGFCRKVFERRGRP
ncbi:replication initiator protein A [Mameliella alba]|nr:replication initiator protein A [Antarctobacter heliothermus]MBY6147295.1 replication initiator protein A [Mameliella alba]MCA0957349.1 replication initiator protein A [Mameliella alba]